MMSGSSHDAQLTFEKLFPIFQTIHHLPMAIPSAYYNLYSQDLTAEENITASAQMTNHNTGASPPPASMNNLPLLPHSHTVSYTHLRAHETPEHLVCRLL